MKFTMAHRIPWNKGLKLGPTGQHSEETRKKISKAKMGHGVSDETRQKLRLVNLGKTYEEIFGKERAAEILKKKSISAKNSINAGRFQKGCKSSWYGGKLSKQTIQKIVEKTRGHRYNGESCPKCGLRHKDMTGKNNTSTPIEIRRKIGSKLMGSNNGAWKGGIYPMHKMIRESLEYKDWRKMVFQRDYYRCQICGIGDNLHAHHVKPFNNNRELRFDINNGQTLCDKCHKITHSKFGGKIESNTHSY